MFVDEAGDDKIGNFRPEHSNGHSEWLCLGGYLVKADQFLELEEIRDEIAKSIGGKKGQIIHFKNYKPKNKCKVSEKLAEYSARGFVVCSYKRTLIGYRNERAERAGNKDSNKDWVYNFVTRLLLERVTPFVVDHARQAKIEQPKLKIIMANRKGHGFGHFKAYVHQITNQAKAGTTHLDTRIIEPNVLSYNLVERAPMSSLSGLQLADILVSSTFQSIEQTSPTYGLAPVKKMKKIFAGQERWGGSPLFKNGLGLTVYPAVEAAETMTKHQKEIFEYFDYDFEWLARKK
ncbi:MAG: DUF3800 domain-containing protein [Pseudomonadota bacterium]